MSSPGALRRPGAPAHDPLEKRPPITVEARGMKVHLVLAAGVAAAAQIGCSSNPAASGPPAPVVSVAPAPPPATAAASAAPAAEAAAPVRMYPVARIEGLLDLTATDGGVEIRAGEDQGGGMLGHFRYVPVVNGAPDFTQETAEISRADTTSEGLIELAGKRPDLVYHVISGFRSAASDGYFQLDAKREWRSFAAGDEGLGTGIYPWSKDRLLEFRGLSAMDEAAESPLARLPRMRVLRGADHTAPTLPASLEKRLTKEGFSLRTFRALRTGEVVAVGDLTGSKGFGTVLWKDSPKDPVYFVTDSMPVDPEQALAVLGGDSLAALRLLAGDTVLRLDGDAWVVESKVPKDGYPDVWFGSTLLYPAKPRGMVARLAAGAPWRPIEVVSKENGVTESFAVDPSGVIWKSEDDVLLSSQEPAGPMKEYPAEEQTNMRKARGAK